MEYKDIYDISFKSARLVSFDPRGSSGPKLTSAATGNSQSLAETMLKELITTKKEQEKDQDGNVVKEGFNTDASKLVKFLNKINVYRNRAERDEKRAGVKRNVGTWLANHLTKKGYSKTDFLGQTVFKKGTISISPAKFAKIQEGIYRHLIKISRSRSTMDKLIKAKLADSKRTIKGSVSNLSAKIDKIVKPRINTATQYAVKQSLKLGNLDYSKISKNPSQSAKLKSLFSKLTTLLASHGYSMNYNERIGEVSYKLTNSPIADKKLRTNTQRTQFFTRIKETRV